jgi:hypothetical protein
MILRFIIFFYQLLQTAFVLFASSSKSVFKIQTLFALFLSLNAMETKDPTFHSPNI